MRKHLPSLVVGRRFVDFSRRIAISALFALASAEAWGQQSLTLHQAIAEALVSPAARIAEEQVSAARGQLRQSRLSPNPRLYLQSEDLRPWNSNFSFANSTEDYGYLGQTFELDGKRGRRVALSTAELRRAEAERTLRSQQIAGAVAASYWSAVSALRVADLLRQDLAALDEMVRYHRERVDAGAMRGVDLLRMQVERDRVVLAFQSAERDAEVARIDLFRQIGRAPEKGIALTDAIDNPTPVSLPEPGAALSQRMDLQIAREGVAAAEANLKLQHALGVPDLDLLAGYKRNIGEDTIYTALQLPLPLRNRNQGEIERAEAQMRIARATLEQTEIAVRADIEAATENYERQRRIMQETLPDMRERAKKNLEILTEAYRIGGVDLLRYIDAQRTEIDVEVAALRALAEYRQSVIRLQFAYGVQP